MNVHKLNNFQMECKAKVTKSTKGTEVFEIINIDDDETIFPSLYVAKAMAKKLKGQKVTIQF